MYNLSSYNKLAFNNDLVGIKEVAFAANIESYFGAYVSSPQTLPLYGVMASEISGDNRYLSGMLLALGLGDEVKAAGRYICRINMSSAMSETIGAYAHIGGDMRLNGTASSTISRKQSLGANLRFNANTNNTVACSASLSAEIALNSMLAGWIDGDFSSYNFVTRYLTFHGDFKPGDVLILDSDNYVALLNGENVLHLVSGDWVWMDDRIHGIEFEAVETNLSLDAKILYTEKWL